MKKSIAIVFYGYPIGVSTLIINLARSFAHKGYDVDIFQTKEALDYSSINFSEDNIHYIAIRNKAINQNGNKIGNNEGKIKNKLIDLTIFAFRRFYYFINPILIPHKKLHSFFLMICKPDFYKYLNVVHKFRNETYEMIFGVEVYGLYAAAFLKSLEKQKIIYLNMELFTFKTNNSKDKYLKATLETFALKRSTDYVTFPNKERADVFLETRSYLSKEIIRYLPISCLGEAKPKKGNYFREKFGISSEKKIVLYSGNIIEWAMCLEIVQSVKSWDEEFVLILHSYIENPVNQDYFNELHNSFVPGRVFLSQKHFSFWELDEIMSSADIGLNFYRMKDENFTEIGFSSNKLTQYMKLGIPTISNDIPFFKDFLNKHNCGISISSFEEINTALKNISTNYSVFKQNVINTYNKYFRFEIYFDKYFEQIK